MDMYTLNQIPSNPQIKKFLRSTLFGKNMWCPECKSRKVQKDHERYRCRECRCRFSLLSHTWLKNVRIPLTQFWMILWCWTCAIPIKQTVALTHVTEKSVRRWFDLFRAHLPEESHILERIVQMDEAYFKGKTLVMAKQTGTRRLAFEIVNGTAVQRHHAAYFLFRKVKPGSKLWTDGAAIYKGIDKWWPVEHSRDLHKKFEFAHTSEIEGIFGNYRTFVRRMYHHHRAEYLPEYVREFCFRFSSPELFKNPNYYLTKTLSLVTIAS
jgi:transposase-like protein